MAYVYFSDFCPNFFRKFFCLMVVNDSILESLHVVQTKPYSGSPILALVSRLLEMFTSHKYALLIRPPQAFLVSVLRLLLCIPEAWSTTTKAMSLE